MKYITITSGKVVGELEKEANKVLAQLRKSVRGMCNNILDQCKSDITELTKINEVGVGDLSMKVSQALLYLDSLKTNYDKIVAIRANLAKAKGRNITKYADELEAATDTLRSTLATIQRVIIDKQTTL